MPMHFDNKDSAHTRSTHSYIYIHTFVSQGIRIERETIWKEKGLLQLRIINTMHAKRSNLFCSSGLHNLLNVDDFDSSLKRPRTKPSAIGPSLLSRPPTRFDFRRCRFSSWKKQNKNVEETGCCCSISQLNTGGYPLCAVTCGQIRSIGREGCMGDCL